MIDYGTIILIILRNCNNGGKSKKVEGLASVFFVMVSLIVYTVVIVDFGYMNLYIL